METPEHDRNTHHQGVFSHSLSFLSHPVSPRLLFHYETLRFGLSQRALRRARRDLFSHYTGAFVVTLSRVGLLFHFQRAECLHSITAWELRVQLPLHPHRGHHGRCGATHRRSDESRSRHAARHHPDHNHHRGSSRVIALTSSSVCSTTTPTSRFPGSAPSPSRRVAGR